MGWTDGVEAVVMNYYSNIDRDKIQFDFIFDSDSKDVPEQEIKKMGGKIIYIPPYQKIFKYQKELIKTLKEGNYKIVHSHINVLSVFSLRAAKKAGVPIRIAHSHSTTNRVEFKKNVVKCMLRPFVKLYATHYFACTEHAGKWMFGERALSDKKIFIMNNAISIDDFKFDDNYRKNMRRELGIDNNRKVIGHVGRFVEQKNHEYVIDIFNNVKKQDEDAILLLIGQGPLQSSIKKQVESYGLNDSVFFLGQRSDVNKLYSVMDIFIFPSIYEGLGMAVIEAQTAGCKCVVSNNVPREVKLTELVKFVDLKERNTWIEECKVCGNLNRLGIDLRNIEKKYDIKSQVTNLENIYLELGGIYENSKNNMVV